MAQIKIRDLRDTFYDASGTLSDIIRQVSFVGIGVIWLFVKIIDGKTFIEKQLVWGIGLFIGALLFDVLQYLYKSIVFGVKFRKEEKKFDDSVEDVEENTTLLVPSINYFTWGCWGAKILLAIAGYTVLIVYLCNYITIM